MIPAPAWAVHLGTTAETRVHLALARRRPADPWPMPRVLAELSGLGAVRSGAPRTLGSGRGMPLLSAQELCWHGLPVHLQVTGHDGSGVECVLELPGWDELAGAVPDEDAVWDLVDVVAAAAEAGSGVIGDGEAPLPAELAGSDWRRALRRHVGLLVPEGSVDPGPAGCRYRVLPRSGLEVLLR